MLKHPSSTAGSPTTATPVAPRPPNAATEGSRHPWTAAQWMTASGAVVAEATAGIDPVTVFRHAAGLPHAIFLDSAVVDRAADRALRALALGDAAARHSRRVSAVSNKDRARGAESGTTPVSTWGHREFDIEGSFEGWRFWFKVALVFAVFGLAVAVTQ